MDIKKHKSTTIVETKDYYQIDGGKIELLNVTDGKGVLTIENPVGKILVQTENTTKLTIRSESNELIINAPNLETLRLRNASYGTATTLKVKSDKLKELYAISHDIENLIIENETLEDLYIPMNKLTSIELPISIRDLGLGGNRLKSFDFTKYPNLRNVNLIGNPIEEINVNSDVMESLQIGSPELKKIKIKSKSLCYFSMHKIADDVIPELDLPDDIEIEK